MKGRRQAYFPEISGFVDCPVYDRYALEEGERISGPAMIEEDESTFVVGPSAYVERPTERRAHNGDFPMTAALRVPEEGALSEQELTRLARDVLPGGVLGKFWFPHGEGFIPASADGAYMTSIAGRPLS